MLAEQHRLAEDRDGTAAWKRLGPYLSERQWGTVREDYSASGDAWNHFPHDQARFRAYRHGEDGLAGVSDDRQILCFALALWNGRDPILKERLFGLANEEGNHGEDVKEYAFYLDSTPSHSFMRYLYKYPQAAYPYDDLVRTNAARTRLEPEYELLDTGVFAENRYCDVFVDYAKAAPDDLLVRITVCNRGPQPTRLHLLPTLWFRNTWSWPDGGPRSLLTAVPGLAHPALLARHAPADGETPLGDFTLHCQDAAELLFTENDTNTRHLYGVPNANPYVKDAFHAYLVHGQAGAVNPERRGSKACARYTLDLDRGGQAVIRLRLTGQASRADPFGPEFDRVLRTRQQEADAFYAALLPAGTDPQRARVVRQALAGMFWTKQYYQFDLDRWLHDHDAHPLSGSRRPCRNRDWFHLQNAHVISMPDKWEYPWYAAWDLAFHAVAISLADPDCAKEQLLLMLRPDYMHPNGQIPAYEWNFGDVNPPVQAWATLFVYRTEQSRRGVGDLDFLKRSFAKLLINFTWWVNRKDRQGRNVFDGGFLGLDNIGVFDRSKGLPEGSFLEQADATAWMALYCQNMVEMSLELTRHDPTYEDLLHKFLEHFLLVGTGMNHPGDDAMWDEEDGFYYDLLRLPGGQARRLRARSMVGLLPLCAATVIEAAQYEGVMAVVERLGRRRGARPDRPRAHPLGQGHRGVKGRGLLALLDEHRLRRVLARMLDPDEFLSPYGLRSLSRHHLDQPYAIRVQEQEYRVGYVPGESDSGMFGGNSNWRGPVWMPVNQLVIRALLQYYRYYGDNFRVQCPTGSGVWMTLFEVAREIAERLVRLFLPDASGRRPALGQAAVFHEDPHWRDCLLFHEYFHGDDGTGLGASHQTGWTGLVAKCIQLFDGVTAREFLEADSGLVFGPDASSHHANPK